MSLPASQQRILDRIEHSLHVSDPRLSSMFANFTKLAREEGMPLPKEVACQPQPRRGRFLLPRPRRERPMARGGRGQEARGSGPRAVILILIALLGLAPAAFLGRGLSVRRRSSDSASEHRTWTTPGQDLPASAVSVCISCRRANDSITLAVLTPGAATHNGGGSVAPLTSLNRGLSSRCICPNGPPNRYLPLSASVARARWRLGWTRSNRGLPAVGQRGQVPELRAGHAYCSHADKARRESTGGAAGRSPRSLCLAAEVHPRCAERHHERALKL
jgi:hypothetical protein